MKINQQSYYLPISETDTLHLKRLYCNPNSEAVFLLHGSIENGKIFYSKNMKGLGPFLAKNGFDVFIADMQGRGESTPKMNKRSTYGQVDVIKTDIPIFLDKIKELKGDNPIHTMAHSWGGVLMLAYLARFSNNIKSLVLFGSKRQLTVRGWAYWKLVFNWYIIGNLFMKYYGYLPAKEFGFGSDNEPKNHFKQINKWLKPKSKWIDNVDGFDYGKALEEKEIPPCLFLAGKNDKLLGNPIDVKLLQAEVKKSQQNDYWLMAKSNKFLQDYDHINMLTHKNAPKDTFPKILGWLSGLN